MTLWLCLGDGRGGGKCKKEHLSIKRQEKTFESGGVHHLDSGDGFAGVQLCQNVSNCTL